jgi:hypothetical protein
MGHGYRTVVIALLDSRIDLFEADGVAHKLDDDVEASYYGRSETMIIRPYLVNVLNGVGRASRHKNLAQVPLENLAIGVARQRAFETPKRLWHLVVGEEIGAVALKLSLIDCVTKHGLARHLWRAFSILRCRPLRTEAG